MPTLKPVGHQSTNWMVLLVFMVAMAALTSFGTTSPLKNVDDQQTVNPKLFKQSLRSLNLSTCQCLNVKVATNITRLSFMGFVKKLTYITCSMPYISHDVDRISPSDWLVQNKR